MGDPATLKYLRKKVKELLVIMRAGPEVALIHCAAGIHRTGSLGYTILRLAANEPLSPEQAYLSLKTLREDTWKGVGEWRIQLAENSLVQPLLQDKPEDPSVPEDCPEGLVGATQA